MASNEVKKNSTFLIRLPPDLLEQAREKAGLIPLARVIRRLLEKWINDEIDLD